MPSPMRFCRLLLLLTLWTNQPLCMAAALNEHFFLARDGHRLHYLQAGNGDSRTLVLVPGWLMPASVFRHQLERLGDEFTVLALDPRSQGKSDVFHGSHNVALRMNDMEDFVAAAGIKDFVLAGWSLGALEALDFVERKTPSGLKGLIVIDNSIGTGPAPAGKPGVMMTRLHGNTYRLRYLTDFCHAIFPLAQSEMAAEAIASALQVPAEAAIELINQPYPRTHWWGIVAKQQVPLLYAIRPRFRVQANALLAAKGTLAQVEVFEDAGHALFADRPERFNALAAAFVRRSFSFSP